MPHSFITRPLGALLMGHIGDKYGRRFTFLIAIIIMASYKRASVGRAAAGELSLQRSRSPCRVAQERGIKPRGAPGVQRCHSVGHEQPYDRIAAWACA